MTMPYGALGCRCWYWDQDAEGGDWGWEANPACPLHAPMTAEEARDLSAAPADPDRPTRKLPPRPDRRCRLCESEWIGKFHPSGRAIAARSITEGKVTIPCEGHPERCPEHGIDDCVCSGPPDYTITVADAYAAIGTDACNHEPITEKRTAGVFSAIKRRALRWLRGDR